MMLNGVSNYSIFYDEREDPTILNTTTYIFWPTKIIKNHSMPNVKENEQFYKFEMKSYL